VLAARSVLSCTAKFRECRFYVFPADDFTTRHLAQRFVDSPKFVRGRVIHAAPARLDIANNLSQFPLVLLGPSLYLLEELFGALNHAISISRQSLSAIRDCGQAGTLCLVKSHFSTKNLLTHPENARHSEHILGRERAVLVLGVERASRFKRLDRS
jgi:hypothetical protein